MVEEALQLTATNLDVFWEAELYRLKGKLMLAQPSVQSLGSGVQPSQKPKVKSQKTQPQHPASTAEAEACFQQAIEIARNKERNRWSCGP